MNDVNKEIHRFGDLQRILTDAESRTEAFSHAEFVSLFRDKIQEQVSESKILSLDVFDTFLMRDNSSELFRFWEVAQNISEVIKIDPAECLMARYLGVRASYRLGERVMGCREGSLLEIHKVASNLLIGSPRLAEEFVQIELECEIKRLVPNELLIDIVENASVPVILLSDMYAHAEHIEAMLNGLGVSSDLFHTIISSADTQVSKHSGRIFNVVENKLGMNSSDFFHFGDAFRGDFVQPKLNGWNAMHLPVPSREVALRREDHFQTAEMLLREFEIELDIKAPS